MCLGIAEKFFFLVLLFLLFPAHMVRKPSRKPSPDSSSRLKYAGEVKDLLSNLQGKLKKISRISGQMFGLLLFVRAVLPLVVYSVLPVIPSVSHWIQHFVIYLSLQYRQIDIVGCFLVSDVASNFYVMAFICYKYRRMRAGRLCYRLAKLHETFFTILAWDIVSCGRYEFGC